MRCSESRYYVTTRQSINTRLKSHCLLFFPSPVAVFIFAIHNPLKTQAQPFTDNTNTDNFQGAHLNSEKFMRQWNETHRLPLTSAVYGCAGVCSHCYFPLIRIIFHLSARQTNRKTEKYKNKVALKRSMKWKIVSLRLSLFFFFFHSFHLSRHSYFGLLFHFKTLIYNNSLAFVIRTAIYISHGNLLEAPIRITYTHSHSHFSTLACTSAVVQLILCML